VSFLQSLYLCDDRIHRDLPGAHQVRHAPGEHFSLAGAGAGDDEQRDGGTLFEGEVEGEVEEMVLTVLTSVWAGKSNRLWVR
jgi:hypothetical protein